MIGPRLVSEAEFRECFFALLDRSPLADIGSVTGPGRSGAVAAVYASHHLRVPFVPYGARCPRHLGRLLIVDTAIQSGKTLRKAERKYRDALPYVLAAFEEPPRVYFWYERPKPQLYRHEERRIATP